jgi:serine/threonine-protein kinase PpkA
MIDRGRKVLTAILAMALACMANVEVAAQSRQPQLMEGKRTLFKRAIVRPGASLLRSASDQAQRESLAAFSVVYVYGTSGQFVEIGRNIGAADGFVRADKLIDWKQTIVAVFNNPAGRERSLLFKEAATIDSIAGDRNARTRLAALRADAAAGRPGDGSVQAIEPATPPDMRENFYFLPILSVANARLGHRINGHILNVASLSLVDPPPPPTRGKSLGDMKVGVVFVVDTTSSMGPYIEKVRQAIVRLQGKLGQSEAGRNMRFGLIGFRQALEASPGVEYNIKTFVKLDNTATAEVFVREIAKVKESPVSTNGFREDSLGGVYEAVQKTSWEGFDARFVILVTDAGPLLSGAGRHVDSRGFGPSEIRAMAAADGKKVNITVIHLWTPEGASDHASAQQDYQALARGDQGTSYFDVPDGLLDRFTGQLDNMAAGVDDRIRAIAANDNTPPVPTGNRERDSISRNFYAMQLAFLGRRDGSRAPDMFESYMADRDLTDPTKSAVDIRLFLTKNQLATMHDVAKKIVELGERSSVDPTRFFTQLRQAIASMARDPNRRVDTQATTLGGALGEFLEGLPYASASPILSTDEQSWIQMGAGAQIAMRASLASKLRFFEEWHNTPSNWVALNANAPEGEKVTAFPLAQLP